MKIRNGFTLIELLAVIVILAIIMLIAGPLVLNLVNKARKDTFESTAYGIIEASNYNYETELLNSNQVDSTSFTYEDGVESSNPAGKHLNYKGERPKSGMVVIDKDGKIAMAIYNGQFCVEKDYDDAEVQISDDKTEAECTVIFNADTSGANPPELAPNMIPIKWDGSKWVKADLNNIAGSNQWYDYNAQKWANVVLVSQASRAGYLSAAMGTEIHESDVMAYLVWIPRYRYTLFNIEASSIPINEINIIFEPSTKAKSLWNTNGLTYTHPAFSFGDKELNGFWVGKFETTGSDTTPTIKPNSLSLSNQTASAQFTTAQLFNSSTVYGLAAANDAHMMKNIEWGAVACLSQSKYGKFGNSIYTGATGLEKEIYINNINTDLTTGNGSTITGCAGATVSAAMIRNNACPSENQYHANQGIKASTTGNIYGIYDMAGGIYDRVLGGTYNSDGVTINKSNSGFTVSIDDDVFSKYIDKYSYSTSYTSYSRRILGDATGETRGWNGDYIRMPYSSSPWIERGQLYSATTEAGLFATSSSSGVASPAVTFRVVTIVK